MVAIPPLCDFGWKAPEFSLPATDGRILALSDLKGPNGTLVIFMCNHCPYVKAILDRIIRDAKDLALLGVTTIAVSSNDAANYPEDSFPEMKALAQRLAFPFPYLYDESQDVARAYGAICTPDFFGFNANLELQYRGRLDESRKDAAPPGVRRDLYEAMALVARSGHGPKDQLASAGCSIKWKSA